MLYALEGTQVMGVDRDEMLARIIESTLIAGEDDTVLVMKMMLAHPTLLGKKVDHYSRAKAMVSDGPLKEFVNTYTQHLSYLEGRS
jgi:hypothetical protein